MYEHMMRVPLIVRAPGPRRPATTVDFHTVNVDLAPTMAEYAGIAMPGTDGLSLRPLIDGGRPVPQRPFVIGQYYSKQQWVNPIRMVRTARFKYNRYNGHGEELYDLAGDPEEINNRAADPGLREEKEELWTALRQWMRENDDPFDAQVPTTRDGRALATESHWGP